MSILDRILATIAPYDCLGCGLEGGLVCAACEAAIIPVAEHCYRCFKPSEGSRTCSNCQAQSRLQAVYAATPYSGHAKDLVWKLKSGGVQSAAKRMVDFMMPVIDQDSNMLIVPIPTATTRIRQRGYDQAALLAHEVSRRTRLPCTNVLRRSGQAHQVGASRKERLSQLKDVFRVTRPKRIKDSHILLVDDVLTTGATFEAAAEALLRAGAARVDAVAFAVAEFSLGNE